MKEMIRFFANLTGYFALLMFDWKVALGVYMIMTVRRLVDIEERDALQDQIEDNKIGNVASLQAIRKLQKKS